VDLLYDIQTAKSGAEAGTVISKRLDSLIQVISDKSYLRSLGDLMRFFDQPKSIQQWAPNFVASWVPNSIRSGLRASDDYIRETRFAGKDDDWWKKAARTTLYKAFPAPFAAPPPKVDLWGREVEPIQGGHPFSDTLYRFIVPARRQTIDDPIAADQVLANWNDQNPEAEFFPVTPSATFRVGRESFHMGPELYNAYLRLAGQTSLRTLSRARMNVEQPTQRDLKRIQDAIRFGRKRARQRLGIERIKNRVKQMNRLQERLRRSGGDAALEAQIEQLDNEVAAFLESDPDTPQR